MRDIKFQVRRYENERGDFEGVVLIRGRVAYVGPWRGKRENALQDARSWALQNASAS